MFGRIITIGNNLKRLDKKAIVNKVMSEPSVQRQMIDLNQEQLYEKGIDSEGKPTGEYSAATIYGTKEYEGKIAKGQRYDHITLKDSGEYYESMKVVRDGDAHKIIARAPEGIEQQFPDALGLTEESKDEIMPEIKERTIEETTERIFQ